MKRGRTSSGTRRSVRPPSWIAQEMPTDPAVLRVYIREGIQHVAERRGHAGFALGLRVLIDLDGFIVYACGRPGAVTPAAAALWQTNPKLRADPVMTDLFDTCRRIVEGKLAGDYWADFLATIRGALLS